MEPRRGIRSRRILLPSEVEFCNLLGLSEEEYWFFVDKTESYNGKRPEAYDLVPDIQAGNLPMWGIQLIIGIALTVVSYLMTPKPKKSKTPPSLKTSDAQGPKRYSPQTGFDSVQEVAEIGQIIPLVFADRQEVEINDTDSAFFGGVRVNSKLVWSQLKSLGAGQQLKAIFMMSSGALGGRPEFQGYAIGDTLLENYINSKLRLYFRPGEESTEAQRLKEIDAYDVGTLSQEKDRNGHTSSDALALPMVDSYTGGFIDTTFSSTRSPQTQSTFGAYSPIPNGQRYVLPYELVMKGKSIRDKGGTVDAGINHKRLKLQTHFPRCCAVTKIDKANQAGSHTATQRHDVSKGDFIIYTISDRNLGKDYETDFGDWKAQDIKSSVDAIREEADDILSIGNQYLVGSAIAVCVDVNYSGIWEPGGPTKTYTLKVEEKGRVQVADINGTDASYESYVIMKLAEGIVTNTRACNTSEIGLKSTVWKQITGFANVNTHPGNWEYNKPGIVHDYEEADGSITLGSINKYITRFSFFDLYVRKTGEGKAWQKLNADDKPFCIRGRTPQPQYNQIRIEHSFGQYEFRFLPLPGNRAFHLCLNKTVYLLKTGLGHETFFKKLDIADAQFTVRFEGDSEYLLTPNATCNPEWWIGSIPVLVDSTGQVKGFDKNREGPIPQQKGWVVKASQTFRYGDSFSAGRGVQKNWSSGEDDYYTYNWSGERIGRGGPDGKIKGKYKYTRGSAVDDSHTTTRWNINRSVEEDVDTLGSLTIPSVSTTTNGKGSGLKLKVKRYENNSVSWSIADGEDSRGKNYKQGDTINFDVSKVEGGTIKISTIVKTEESSLQGEGWPKSQNLNPHDATSDYVNFDAERTSHFDNPEHEITYINELIDSAPEEKPMPYTQMAIAGLRMNSSTEWNSFQQLSAYIKEGIQVKKFVSNGLGSSNLFPEIAYHLLTDKINGAGNLIGVTSIDEDSIKRAAYFCKNNNFFWDGVITENQNLREFIYQQASYCFLDFTIIGGKFALKPSVPYKLGDYIQVGTGMWKPMPGKIDIGEKPPIKALFTDGNTKDLKVSFLSPEERQLFQAKVMYREETENGFAETKVIEVKLSASEGGSSKDPYEVFDMSVFCTNKAHALQFAKFALRVRQKVDHGIKFKTTPQSAMHLEPGQYFRYYSEATHTDRFANGVITADGTIQSQVDLTAGTTYDVYYWKPANDNFKEVKKASMKILDNGNAPDTFRGSVFTIAKTDISDRVYKLESLIYDEDGFVDVAGSYQPLKANGALAILDWNNDTSFEITGG
tara:strand:- start:1702 stop:5556 length:3855 start_codon:yes stop_codon:yes gene_type:complete